MASAPLGAAVPPSNTPPPPPPPAGRATSTEVVSWAQAPTMSQAPSPASPPSPPSISSLCSLLLLLLELELKLLSALIFSLPKPVTHEVPLFSIGRSPLESYSITGQSHLLSTGPGGPISEVLCSSLAVITKVQVTGSLMYRVCIPVVLPLLFSHLYC